MQSKGGDMNVLLIALDSQEVDVDDADVLVVAPALNSRLRRWTSDEDGARRRAAARAEAFVERLRSHGVHAEGRVGDGDPVQAIADTLATFPADEIVIAAHRERSHRLAARARKRFALPILQAEELSRAA
jgi:hypothetical protein